MASIARTFIVTLLLAASSAAAAAPPTTCGFAGDYAKSLCAYQQRRFTEAEAGFRSIVDRNEDDAHVVQATYFLARTEMKLGRFDEAATLFVRIYSSAPGFYRDWNCDFLLGECRKAAGKE